MRIFTEINPDIYDRIEEVINNGKYRDIDQFIRVAVQNQLNIEESGNEQPQLQQSELEPESQPGSKSGSGFSWGYTVPDNPPVGSAYEMDRENELLFQQYYRFFPLIPVMIELAKVTTETSDLALLSEFRNRVDRKIEPLRNAIVDWEERNNIKKKNRKSTGLPKRDVKNPKYSRKRYLDHFVGKVRKRDLTPKSFGHSLGLISYEPIDTEKILIQLTPAGKRLLEYENPLLSNGPKEPTLNSEERKFIISHIETTLPAEYRLMEFVYSTIADNGNETYTNRIDEFGEYLVSEGALAKDASEERVRSHIAGALSRMVELGVLERGTKRGVYLPESHPEELVDASIAEA